MPLMIAGLLLWALAHWFKRIAPAARARLGDPGKGLIALLLVASILMMGRGYRVADVIAVWSPPGFLVHLNNLLMLVAIFIFATAHTKGRLRGWTRHPMLISVKVWAFAHLLVNGDLASILLFGGLLIWAVVSVILINKAEPDWTRPEPGPAKKDLLLVIITLVVFVVVTGIHYGVFGIWPFPS